MSAEAMPLDINIDDAEVLAALGMRQKPSRRWAASALKTNKMNNQTRVVGFISPTVLSEIQSKHKLVPASAPIEIRGEDVGHALRDSKRFGMLAVPKTDILALPILFQKPQAVLYSIEKKNLLYVFPPEGDKRHRVFAVHVAMRKQDYTGRGGRRAP